MQSLLESIFLDLRAWLGTFGRPIPCKRSLLVQHEARVYQHQAEMARISQKKLSTTVQTSKNVIKEQHHHHASDKLDWSKLKPVSIRDLKLFETSTGSVLEGKLLTDPFTPMVGCTTVLEDRNGDAILVALYNFLPDGATGEAAGAIASTKIPKGCKVRIAEPFLKIFRDGGRGIRIDNPHEISVVLEGKGRGGGAAMLETVKSDGNALVGRRMYHAAAETYIGGIRKEDVVPTILSNRAQAFIMMEDWPQALADAAASLTMRPGCQKTWARYRKALGKLESRLDSSSNETDRATKVLELVFLAENKIAVPKGTNLDDDVSALKGRGNQAFLLKDYEEAKSLYSRGLALSGATSRAILSNWSLCCLHMGALHDALAASAASLRISPDGKAIYRLCKSLLLLGQPELTAQILEKTTAWFDSNTASSSMHKLNKVADTIADLIKSGNIRDPREITAIPEALLPYWYGGIEIFDAGEKGRGVRATADMQPNQIILIERPLVLSEMGTEENDQATFLMSTGEGCIFDTTQTLIVQTIISRSQREGLFSSILDNLYDGINSRPLVPLEKLIPNVTSTPLLLPSHHEYMPEEQLHLSSKRVEGLVVTNSHGTGYKACEEDGQYEKDLSDRSTNLFPAASMFNHSSHPTCGYVNISNCNVLMTVRNVRKGDELTVCYHPDEDTVRRKWGI